MPETDTRKKDYNLRPHGGKNLTATTKRKEGKGSQTTTSHSSTRGAMLPQGASGGAAIADVSTTSSASETSVLDVSGPPAPAPPVTVVTPDVSGPPAQPVTVVTPELQSFMKDVKDMFRNFTTQVNDKLDKLPTLIKSANSLEIFKKLLKTHLFPKNIIVV